jgi:hypothetical protein
MPNDDKRMRDVKMRDIFRNLDIDPRENQFNPDARGYLEMGYDQINPDSLNRPQTDPKLDAVMKMLNEMKMIG